MVRFVTSIDIDVSRSPCSVWISKKAKLSEPVVALVSPVAENVMVNASPCTPDAVRLLNPARPEASV